jgi:hypothetical protein
LKTKAVHVNAHVHVHVYVDVNVNVDVGVDVLVHVDMDGFFRANKNESSTLLKMSNFYRLTGRAGESSKGLAFLSLIGEVTVPGNLQ